MTVPVSPKRPSGALRLAGVLAVSAGLLAACGGSDEAAGGLTIEGAWARNSPMMATAGAAYMDLTASETTSLVSASVPADVAGTVEIHEVVPVDTSEMDSDMSEDMDSEDMDSEDMDSEDMDHSEMGMDMPMTMQEVDAIELPAGETVSLAPGGYHVMLLDLPDALELGETFELTLTLEDGTETVVEVEVREEAP